MPEDVIKADPPQPRPADIVAEPEGNGHGHRNLGIALALICMAQLMVVLDGTIVNIALPHIQTDLGFSNASLPWVVNAYALAFGGLLLSRCCSPAGSCRAWQPRRPRRTRSR
jgi:hypothetical protein